MHLNRDAQIPQTSACVQKVSWWKINPSPPTSFHPTPVHSSLTLLLLNDVCGEGPLGRLALHKSHKRVNATIVRETSLVVFERGYRR